MCIINSDFASENIIKTTIHNFKQQLDLIMIVINQHWEKFKEKKVQNKDHHTTQSKMLRKLREENKEENEDEDSNILNYESHWDCLLNVINVLMRVYPNHVINYTQNQNQQDFFAQILKLTGFPKERIVISTLQSFNSIITEAKEQVQKSYAKDIQKLFTDFGMPILRMFRFSYNSNHFDAGLNEAFINLWQLVPPQSLNEFSIIFLEKAFKMAMNLLVRERERERYLY